MVVGTARTGYSAEQIIAFLCEVEVRLGHGQKTGQVCPQLGICEQTYFRWRKEDGGLKVSRTRRLKDLQRDNSRLKKAIADRILDKLILREALEGNF